MTAASALTDTIIGVIARAPDWLRVDLLSKDAAKRRAAEEALAAMIGSALDDESRHNRKGS